MVYFRLKHVRHGTEEMQRALCSSMWADLPPAEEAAAAASS